jgi:hypothetical protein
MNGMKLDRAYVGSCTGGKTSDFVEFARVLRGHKVSIDTFGVPDGSSGMDTDTVFVNADTGAWSWQAFGLSSKTDTADGEPKVPMVSCS